MSRRLVWLRRDSQIRFRGSPTTGKLLLRSFIRQRWNDDHIVSILPINRRRNTILRSQLKRIDHAQNLVEIASRTRRIRDHQFDFLVWTNHKHRANGKHIADLRMDHVVKFRDLMVWVRNHRKIERSSLGLSNILRPTLVRIGGVYTESNYLHAAFFKIRLAASHVAQLSSANGGEILRMGEQDRPAIAKPLVKTDGAFGGLCCEIGCYIAKS